MVPRSLLVFGLLVFGAGGTGGCDLPGDADCPCTLEFTFLTVTVRDGSGQPVSGVTITVTQLRTGQVLPVQQGASIPGTYIILDDSFRSQILAAGETIRVTGQKGVASFSQDFVVQSDACGCHVSRVSGPATVTL